MHNYSTQSRKTFRLLFTLLKKTKQGFSTQMTEHLKFATMNTLARYNETHAMLINKANVSLGANDIKIALKE